MQNTQIPLSDFILWSLEMNYLAFCIVGTVNNRITYVNVQFSNPVDKIYAPIYLNCNNIIGVLKICILCQY